MNITFCINYRAEWGQTLCVISDNLVLDWTEVHPLPLNCLGTDFWTATVPVSDFIEQLTYRYAIRLSDGTLLSEAGNARSINLSHAGKKIVLHDFWQTDDYEKAFRSTAFLKALFKRKETHRTHTSGKRNDSNLKNNDCQICFSIDAPQVLPTQGVAVMGNIAELGNWNADDKFILSDNSFPIWTGSLQTKPDQVIEYKYVIYDLQTGNILDMEAGENRQVWGLQKGLTVMQNDRVFRRTQPKWKGAGVAVPVFSLRTEDGFGIGEFQDLKKLADWAALTGQKMIQTLPINDTTLLRTNRDSYPYNAVSVFALHPIYLNIEKTGRLTPAQKKKYLATKEEFNRKPISDYQVVYDEKMKYLTAIYKAEKEAVFSSAEYKAFFEKNREWLVPYAVFCYLRDKNGTPHFYDWKQYSVYNPKDVEKLSQPTAKDYYKVALHFFLQFHLDKQLSEAIEYAHSKGVALKGDIPIGISPDSVDAWTDPQLFNLNASAGAPPDDFSISGQNWGFPTYNWDVMAKDEFRWWKRRFTKMADYFDAYRIDHILGFFRIWQMPKSAVWGLTGHFSPAMPYSMQDLWNMGVKLDEDRLVKPYIRSNFLGEVFGYETEYAKQTFLQTNDGYIYWFKDEFDTQLKVQEYFEKNNLTDERSKRLRDALYYLHCEVLFVRDQTNPTLLHPRISLFNSHSYNELWDDQKHVLTEIHNDYFYRRHNEFWYQSAMRKLPSLIDATDMLVCGEDLGMVPDCVPDVMHRLQILSLEIQRMPKNPKITFAHPADAPYLSVCTTGTHDTNPLRAWWEEDREKTQQFYNEQMGWWGEAPKEMSAQIAECIINQHMYSPAMWVILPLQDWMAADENIRLEDQHAERINLPENPRHFWCYRMHLRLEELLNADDFNRKIKDLVARRN
ncbi:MAG: 4-alpha-glucanotransferase [Paludibacter sp.]|nr:4-alpha-glucanotransferase [Bacteroidales bacterium]MCM1068517.1 4-alpha-glucanotransferase [Prevotella sp.]MCM1353471.1 4-alpha-glucanotransferase [Bacteroides sp.]MCM1442632.1 4-alpha-glucanotransferase [Muribaculum sp.]MCM1481477.1 4-alpha-glucanotransferase [Paludibacter sp.]